MYFDALLQRIREAGSSPAGASLTDIEALESTLGVRFPAAYGEFLAVFGRDNDGLWVGTDLFLDHIPQNHAICRQLLVDNELDPSLVDGAVVWLTHQGYIASWFFPADEPDPPVYLFNEAARERGVHSPGSFTELVHADAKDLLSLSNASVR